MRGVLGFCAIAVACSRPAPPPAADDLAQPAPPPPAAVAAEGPTRGDRMPSKLDWVDAPAEGDVAAQVRSEWARAQRDNRTLLVYVGASWCEPCRYFHDAALAGRLDDAAAGVRLLAYDLDRDKDRLAAAGYSSDMIPLLAGTAPDGLGTTRKLAGGVKGPEAVDFLIPRLQRLALGQRRFDSRASAGLGAGRPAPAAAAGTETAAPPR